MTPHIFLSVHFSRKCLINEIREQLAFHNAHSNQSSQESKTFGKCPKAVLS